MPKIYTTIGLYPNGTYKTNGVSEEHIQSHIEYNKTFRPGRTLFIDGEVEYRGIGISDDTLKEFKDKIKVKPIVVSTCTAPYH